MSKGPFGLPRLTDIGPLTESPPNRILVDEDLASRLEFAVSQTEGQDKGALIETRNNIGRPGAALDYVVNSELQIDDQDYMTTSLTVGCKQASTDEWPTAFHRLVMPDTEKLREGMESLASKRTRINPAPLGDSGVGSVAFGMTHFLNPGNYTAAHWNVGEFKSKDDFMNTANAVLTMFENAVDVEKSSDDHGLEWWERNA